MPHAELDRGKEAPPMPETLGNPDGGSNPPLADASNCYREVRFHGNYGAGCGQYQEFMRYNINDDQIRQIGWAAFGLCGWNADKR
jgi:hypothetical protein